MKQAMLLLFIIFACYGRAQESKTSSSLYRLEHGRIVQSLDQGKTWEEVSNSPTGVLTLAVRPDNPEQLLVATERYVYSCFTKKQFWEVVFDGGEGFTPTEIKYSPVRWWEVWMAGKVKDENGRIQSVVWVSLNGGVTWNTVRRFQQGYGSVHLVPESAEKLWIEQTQQQPEGK